MDRLSEYSELVSLPGAVAFVCVAVVLLQAAPSRFRLEAALAAMVVVLTVGRLPEIGFAADLAKMCSGFMFLLVASAAIQRPGKKMPIPSICWGYAVVAALAVLFVIHTADCTFALVLRAQWLMLVISALLTLRTVVNEQALKRILIALLVGMVISCLITLSALTTDPRQAIQSGLGRFMPYGCNPNQIGVMYAVTVALGLYFSLTTKHSVGKVCSIGCTVLAICQSLLTVSRGSFLVIGLTAMPSSFRAFRRPLFAALAVGFLAVVLYSLLAFAESCDFQRIGSEVSGRTLKTMNVLEEVKLRPYWGLAFTEGLYAFEPNLNAHNAYVSILYLGGIAIGLPLFALQLHGQYCMAQTWMGRRQLPIDPLLISVLAGFSVALCAHGFVNEMIYYPTYTWAFLNVLISSLFIMLDRCRRGVAVVKTATAHATPTSGRPVPMVRPPTTQYGAS